MRTLFWTAFWIFLIDQVSKFYVVHVLKLDVVKRIEVFEPFLVLQMAWNRGVNFGLFADFDMRWVLVAVAILITVGVLVWLWRSGGTKWAYLAGGVLIGGALGNVVDRVIYGAVADFLNMSCCGFENPFSYNVADIAVFTGAIGLIVFTGEKKST